MPTTAGLPLKDLRVADLSGVLGAYCSRLLADLGADVVKIEPPEGDEMRRQPPFRHGATGPDASLLFGYYHRGKRSITLDSSQDAALPVLRQLGAWADVVLISPTRRQPLAGYRDDPPSLPWAEGAIVVGITPFGLTGPDRWLRATPFTSFARGGQMSCAGPPEGPPVAMPGRQLYDEAGVIATLEIQAAIVAQAGPQLIDVSVHEVTAAQIQMLERYSLSGRIIRRESNVAPAPSGLWQCRDGVLDLAIFGPNHWKLFVELLDHEDELLQPLFEEPAMRLQLHDVLGEVVARLLATRSAAGLVEKGQALGLPCALHFTPDGFLDDVQPAARRWFTEAAWPDGSRVRVPGPAFRATPPLLEQDPRVPGLGQHNGDVLTAALGGGADGPARLPDPASRAPTSPGALRGVRVLSLGGYVAGNTCCQLLAELGADVVKVESPSYPDALRAFVPTDHRPLVEPSGVKTAAMFAGFARSVRGVALEMARPEGRALFQELATTADVVLENLGPGIVAKWGCDHADLIKRNPNLVMVAISGYGKTGPRSPHRSFASNINNYLGLTAAWKRDGNHFDYVTAYHAAVAALAALAIARRDGTGVYVDLAQIEAGGAVMAPLYLDRLANGRPWVAAPNDVPGSVLSVVVRCLGDDAWAAVDIVDMRDWNTLCDVLDLPSHRVGSDAAGVPAGDLDTVEEAFRAWAAQRTDHQVELVLQRAGLATGAVLNTEELFRDPQLHARDFLAEIHHPDIGPVTYPAPLPRMSTTPARIRRPAPRLGQHTTAVLADWLGLDEDQIRQHLRDGAAWAVDAAGQPVDVDA